jgi:hypothetical protein
MSDDKTYIIRVKGKNKITGNKEFLQNVIATLGLPYRWSDSKSDFILIEDMHDNHLLNSLKEEISLVGTNSDLKFILNGPLYAEWCNRATESQTS